MILSIVIPAYNAEPYLSECIDSIVTQVYSEEVEIIIVDDGSTDKTGKLADDYMNKYPFISVIHQTNGGLSNARNIGFSKSKGRYVWFVDADDWISQNALRHLLPILNIDKFDGVAIMANRVNSSYESPHFHFTKKQNCCSSGISQLETEMSCCVPFTIYRRSFLINNNLQFYEGIFHEDTEFSPRAYAKLDNLYLLGRVLYLVRQTPGSITRSINFKKNFDIITVSRSLDKFCKDEMNGKSKTISKRIALCVNASLLSIYKMNNKQRQDFFVQLKHNSYLFKHYFRTGELRYFLEGIMIFTSLKLYSFLYNKYYSL